MKAIRLWTACLLVGSPSYVVLATTSPEVHALWGMVSQGNTISVLGTNFGTHGDFHADPNKLISLFDDFNDGELFTNAYRNWRIFIPPSGSPLSYSTENPRTTIPGDGFFRRLTNSSNGHIEIPGGNYFEYYASFWMRFPTDFHFLGDATREGQLKVIRLESSNSTVDLYAAFTQNSALTLAAEHVNPEVVRCQLDNLPVPSVPVSWHKLAIYIRKSTVPDANDGKWLIWWDNRLVFDWIRQWDDPKNNPPQCGTHRISGDFDSDGADLALRWSLGNYLDRASHPVDFDDVYLSHTLAHGELGNAPFYRDCTLTEHQVPEKWSASAITFRVNQGAFQNGDRVYLYIFDSNGVANEPGYPLTISHQPIAALGIRRKSDIASVFWPSGATNFTLEGTQNLMPIMWGQVTNATDDGTEKAYLIKTDEFPQSFYRLRAVGPH